MKGLVVLDGPDAAGKTTLANALMKVNPLSYYIHMTYIKNDRQMFLANYMALVKAQILMEKGYLVVIDRGWMSENIYADVYRGGSGLAYDVRGLDRVIMRLCGIYVVCAPDPDRAVELHRVQHVAREEMYAPGPEIRKIADRYRRLWFGCAPGECLVERDYALSLSSKGVMRRPDCLLYDIDDQGKDIPRMIKRILGQMAMLQEQQHEFGLSRAHVNYLGMWHMADTLFVGDRINPNKRGRWPFVDYGASSRTMSKALHAIGWDETRGVWCNAHDQADTLPDLLEARSWTHIVALGVNAHYTLESLGETSHKVVYHPSYVGRFNQHAEWHASLQQLLA